MIDTISWVGFIFARSAAVVVVIPVHGGRISPVLDVARRFVVMHMDDGSGWERHEERIDDATLVAKTKRIVEIGSRVLICGAVSKQLELMLTSAGVSVIPNRCGAVDDVLEAFISDTLSDEMFLMPGCTSRRSGAARFRIR